MWFLYVPELTPYYTCDSVLDVIGIDENHPGYI